jgi:cytochrome c553
MKKLAAYLSICLGLGLITQVHAEGNAEAGQARSVACAACHGVDGNSVNPQWPSLAGQNAGYLMRQLRAFKAGERENPLMGPQAMMLNDQDIEDLAAYFSSQTIKGGTADPELAPAGERLYRGGNLEANIAACASCHGPGGRGNEPASYPALAGQHADYVVIQLKAYREGSRKTDAPMNQMMRGVAARMTDKEMHAVAAYIQGLRSE